MTTTFTRGGGSPSPSDDLTFLVRSDPGGTTLVVSGELDLASAGRLRRALISVQPSRLDLSGITFVDCAGLREVERSRTLGVQIAGVSGAVRRLTGVLAALDRMAPTPLQRPA